MRRGLIKITDTIYRDSWDAVHLIFKDFKPTYIEFKFWENDIWYFYGVSELFDELKEGDAVPVYDVVITVNDDKSYSYKFMKQ